MYHFKGIVKGYGYGILRHAQVWGGLDLPYFACVVLVVRRLQTPNQTRSSILHFGLVSHLFCFKHNQFLKFANNVISSFHTTFREEPISWSRAGESFPSKKNNDVLIIHSLQVRCMLLKSWKMLLPRKYRFPQQCCVHPLGMWMWSAAIAHGCRQLTQLPLFWVLVRVHAK